jgi:hypothetical protein
VRLCRPRGRSIATDLHLAGGWPFSSARWKEYLTGPERLGATPARAEYALKYQQHLKGLIISNMMASIPQYNEYAHTVLMPAMDQAALAEIQQYEAAGDSENPGYMELLMEHHYVYHILRMPLADWPDAVNRAFKYLNPSIYVPMQGPSELGASGKLLLKQHQQNSQTYSSILIKKATSLFGVAFPYSSPSVVLPRSSYV